MALPLSDACRLLREVDLPSALFAASRRAASSASSVSSVSSVSSASSAASANAAAAAAASASAASVSAAPSTPNQSMLRGSLSVARGLPALDAATTPRGSATLSRVQLEAALAVATAEATEGDASPPGASGASAGAGAGAGASGGVAPKTSKRLEFGGGSLREESGREEDKAAAALTPLASPRGGGNGGNGGNGSGEPSPRGSLSLSRGGGGAGRGSVAALATQAEEGALEAEEHAAWEALTEAERRVWVEQAAVVLFSDEREAEWLAEHPGATLQQLRER